MYSTKDIFNDPVFEQYLLSRNHSPSTQKTHACRIAKFCNHVQKPPQQIILDAEKEQDDGIKPSKLEVFKDLHGYVGILKEEEYSPNSIKSYINSVKTFLNEFGIETPFINLGRHNNNDKYQDLPTKKDLKKAISVSGIRDTAILLLHYSAGIGASELMNLTYHDFLKSMEDYIDPHDLKKLEIKVITNQLLEIGKNKELVGTWHIKRFKTGIQYVTFNSPQSTEAIIHYLQWREHRNPIKTLESPLFVNQINQRLLRSTHSTLFRRVNEKADFGKRENGRWFITSYILIQTFKTQLYDSGVDKTMVDMLLGHKSDEITEKYFKTDVNKLREVYVNALPNLTLEKVKIENVYTDNYDKLLQRQIKTEEEFEKKIIKKNEEIKQLVKELNEIKTKMAVLNEIVQRMNIS